MVKRGDSVTINGRRFEVVSLGDFDTGEDRFVTVKTPEDHQFLVPVELWDAAVQGAAPFPAEISIEKLAKLKGEFEAHTWNSSDNLSFAREDSEKYVQALEGRVRELAFRAGAFQKALEKHVSRSLDAVKEIAALKLTETEAATAVREAQERILKELEK